MSVIWKFGGTSVGSADNIRSILRLVHTATMRPQAIVFSALGGVTDSLTHLTTCSLQEDDALLVALKDRHFDIASTLLNGKTAQECSVAMLALFDELEVSLSQKRSTTSHTAAFSDQIVSFGERLSTLLLTHILQDDGIEAEYLDARSLIQTDDTYGNARPLLTESYSAMREHFLQRESLQCVTGFIGRSTSGQTTTLGRGGSDYTAALIAHALDASKLEIWTDVDGVLSANPRLIPEAHLIPELSYIEAMELSHFGAKVLYPPTIQPVREKQIPLYVRNTLNPKCSGTRISHAPNREATTTPVTAISSVSSISTLILAGPGMVGIPGISSRLFGALAAKGINIILITQASSEHSICFAVTREQAQAAIEATNSEFSNEQALGTIMPVQEEPNCSIISVVGDGMKHQPGIAGAVFSALGNQRINIIAIAQGCSEENISFVVKTEHEIPAIRAVHSHFFSAHQIAHLILIGTGKVGGALLEQLAQQSDMLKNKYGIELRLAGIVKRGHVLIPENSISFDEWSTIEQHGTPLPYEHHKELITHLQSCGLPKLIVVDCTAADSFGPLYKGLLEAKIPIVSANKHVQSGPLEILDGINEHLTGASSVSWRYETSVGAALPIISTLNALVVTGDRIQTIECTLSGSLAFIFDTMQKGALFSEALKQADQLGYLEPDPREDLGGGDFQRKLLILSRLMGICSEMADIDVEPLLPLDVVPARIQSINEPYEAFLGALPELDTYFEQKIRQLASRGKVLRVIGRIDGTSGRATIRLEAVDSKSPFYPLSGSQNMVAFTTDRYIEQPLVIMGPGAGPEITASGVLNDIIETVREIKD